MKNTITLCLLLVCSMANALHGDLHERILKVSKEIKKSPDSAYLYFKRASLYYQHEEYHKSLIDLEQSDLLGEQSIELELQYSMTYLKLQNYSESVRHAQKVLKRQADNVRAFKLIAQNYYEMEAFEKSAIAYENVINNSVTRLPENYVDASMAWENLKNEKGYAEAESILNKGIDDLGTLISLYKRLRELALHQNNYGKAIEVQKEIIAMIPRKEFAYFKLSQLYQLNNNEASALRSLNQSKEYIDKLPLRSKNTTFIRELTDNIKKTEVSILQRN